MNGPIDRKTTYRNLMSTLLLLLALPVVAQVPVDEDGNPLGSYELQGSADGAGNQADEAIALLSAIELEDLVGPVALYPDDLLAIVLPASTYPLEIVQAARFLELLEDDPSLEPDEEWDDSVVALLNYPDVIRMLDEDIDWTWRLGEAVINQQNEIIAAVEAFRDRAYAAGNLKTDEHQKVGYDDEGILEIVPVSEELIYVPYYEPEEVVVYQPRPVYYYYPDPYPVYYYPYPTGYRFRSGYFWGVTTAFSIGWSNHYLHVYHPSYWGHPYYGRYYYGHYYRRPSISIYNTWYVNNSYRTPRYRHRDGDYWRPRNRNSSNQSVRNYHYSPNGSRNSRNYTVTRNDRVRVGNDGRMDLRLRERDGRRTTSVGTANNREARANVGNRSTNDRRSSARNDLTSNSNRTRSTGRDAAADRTRPTSTESRATNTRTNTARNRNEITFRDRSSNGTRPENRAVTASNRQMTTRRNATDRVTTPSRASTASNQQTTSRRNTTTRAATPTRASAPTNRSSTATRSGNNRVSAPPRANAPARRTTSAPRTSAPRTSAPRTSAPRTSAPRTSAPRAAAPAAQPRAPSAPRSNNRSGSRSSSAGAGSRRSTPSRPRVNNNQD